MADTATPARALIVSAHPEPHSFNAALKARAVQTLAAQGYEVDVSDLYAMQFKAVLDREDFPAYDAPVLNVALAQRNAIEKKTLPTDITNELARLQRADLLVLLFPLWWFGMPAILKGWIDRVFLSGITYGRTAVFEHGRLRGKRALVAVTTGAPEHAFGTESLNGDILNILQPLHRGVLGFTGMTVLPPFVGYHVPYISPSEREHLLSQWQAHLEQLNALTPLPMPRMADYPKGLEPQARVN